LNTLVILFPAILILGIYGILALVFHLQRKYRKRKGHRSPFTDNFLRSPGESLNRRIMEISDKMMEHLVMFIIAPILIYALYMSSLYSRKVNLSASVNMLFIIGGTGFIAYHLFKLIKLVNLRQSYRLGYAGEIAVGQELNQLIRDGYYVYHDFPAKNFNIDHIVVGTSGVFAVETKAHSKAKSANSNVDYKVTYDGNRIHFPKGTDVKYIEQARRQAEWLSKWLRSAVGEAVRVRPVVALPGWFVERTSSNGIAVINPKNFRSIAKPKDGSILSDQMVKRIVHQLEQKCRDVEPKARN
jgi:Nuclease-related domain